jgi:hypothetical protein
MCTDDGFDDDGGDIDCCFEVMPEPDADPVRCGF